ncbi:uncharacterized protein LOC112517931 [Cynara cardunculus var. scolymus]|uniref:uncharacterized protein LOC112517931 n=1 Tax=Cynara cardunculus var. scolymus TaxID=59895 RepID=UPI000D627DEB|nr:uncharacterized protein LOC112517931 [Cynara cardunculus var. scolymus]XP_024981128.1 uncharacterized protein LOC112517931 [Cynara cardunculus var. scolymus]
MELRSSRVLKRDKPDINSSIQNHDFGDKKRLQLSSDESNSGKKGANEVEIGVCVDNAHDNLEMGPNNGSKIVSLEVTKNGGNTDDKGLFLGSEVLDPIKDLVVSCPEGEIEEESVERVQVESSGGGSGGGEEGNKPVLINLSEKDGGFKEEIPSRHISSISKLHTSPEVETMDCGTRSKNVESGKFVDDIMITANGDNSEEATTAVLDDSNLLNDAEKADAGVDKRGKKKGKGKRGRKKGNAGNLKKNESKQDSDTRSKEMKVGKADVCCSENGVKRKRGRKRKNVEISECNGDGIAKREKVEKGGVQVNGRLLRSRAMTIGGGVKAVHGRVEVVIGLKRIIKEGEGTELAARPKKKQKRRGRPPKVRPSENSSLNVFKREDENRQPSSSPRPEKKLKRRGRPPKVQGETTLKKDGILTEIPKKKLKRRGRPPKVRYETMPSAEIPLTPKRSRGRPRKETAPQGVQKNRHKDMIFKKLKRRGRPPKIDSRVLANVIKMRTVKLMEVKKNSNRLKANDVKRVPKIQKIRKEEGLLEVSGENPQKVQQFEENSEQMMDEGKGIISKPMKRLKCKQLVRDKIVDILLNSGWIIDRRPRQERAYKDAVYIEPSGRSHWSITRAYLMLKKKIEDGDADSNEVSAYIPISEEEIGMLFRVVDKVHGYKKKKNRKPIDVNKAGIVTKRRKRAGKNTKDGSKRKKIRNSATRSANKSLKHPNREKGIVTESRKPRLLARSSEKVSKQDNDGCLMYSGKRNLLSWMIDLGVILAGSKVQYGKTRRQKRSSEGIITSDGIHCNCCNEIMGISRFVAHAGGKLNQPFDNVYLESGTSLLKCMLDSWRKEEESNTIGFNRVDVKGEDPNDDTCNICGDGGNLICCDGCPSTFHQNCLDIQNFPSGDWNCIYCSCKFCGVVSFTAPQMDDSRDALTSEMLSCGLCEEKFHRSCLQEVEAVNVDSSELPFCGRKCQELFERLQTYLGVKVELEDGFSWTLLQRSDVGQDFSVQDTQLNVECNSKLAVAFSVMDECFVPIVDERSGTSMIRNVVYNCGSNFKRLDYAGFLTAILEKGDELITAASIRIHGYRLAEMPFIGTRHMYRRQGMCRRLLDAIESTLSSIGVEELIIPAIPELLQTWTKVFGFMPLEESKRQAMKYMNMLVFPGIDMLQKPLLRNPLADRSPTPSAVSDDKAVEHTTSEPNDNHSDASEIVKDEAEEATVLMDVCSCPDPNDKTVSQSEPMTSNAIDCNQRPADAAEVGTDDIDNERTKEPTVLMNGCSRHEEAAAGIPKDSFDHEPPEETTGLTGGCSCPKEDVSRLEKDKFMISDGANGLCDLNFPVKNDRCRFLETTGPISSDAKSTDVRTSDDSAADMTCELYGTPKLELDVENDGISAAEASTTSKLAPKNTFDLNLHPTPVDTDSHIVGDNSLTNEPCRTSFELSETRSRVDHGDSKSCDTQPLVIL